MRETIVEVLGWFSLAYKEDILPETVGLWCAVLFDVKPQDIRGASIQYLRGNSPFFPKPGQILAIARPTASAEQEASLVADALITAAESYGFDPIGVAKAEEKVGKLGVEYLRRNGGFEKFVLSIGHVDNITNVKAQLRRSITGLINQGFLAKQSQLEGPQIGFSKSAMGTLNKLDGLIPAQLLEQINKKKPPKE